MHLESLDLVNKKVLVRVDFNVPLDDELHITDDTRIVSALPAIKYILQNKGSVILISHLGRPLKDLDTDGNIKYQKYTLKNIVDHLSSLLDQEVVFAKDCGGPDSVAKAHSMKPGEIILLENTRFYKGEKKGDEAFAKSLADLADIYVNDAFGTAHRSHASTTTVAQFFEPSERGFGFLMNRELENGGKVLNNPQKPVVAIIGGAKVSDKINLILSLLDLTSDILIGGGMAYTFIKAQGGEIGKSLCEDDKLELALNILSKAKEKECEIHLPEDSICADEFSAQAKATICSSFEIPISMMGLDIGPKAITHFSQVILKAKTIVWNGPMGVFEFEVFAKGTLSIALYVAESTRQGAFSLIGGGDSVAAIKKSGLDNEVSFISTGGGAMLELLEGKTLPGVSAIINDNG